MLTVAMGLALSLVTPPAQAGFLTFTNQANWEAALADPTLLEDFEGEASNGGARELNAAVTYTSPNFVMFDFLGGSKFTFPKILAPAVAISPDTVNTWELDFLLNKTGPTLTTIMTLPRDVIAWGAVFDNPANPFEAATVATILTEEFDFANFFSDDNNAEGFFGVISTMGTFDTVTFTGKGGFQGVGIDNIRVGTTPAVPEPSTMLLLGTGLVGLIGYRWKKAQA